MCEMVAEMRGERNNADANIEDDDNDDDNEIVPPIVITIAQAMQMTEQLKVFASCKGRLCVPKRGQHRVGTCGQETHTHLLHADYHGHVRGCTKCGVEHLECLSFCVNVPALR